METTRELTIGNLIFDCRTAGKETDELVIFLHGFPETSHMWKELMQAVSKKGYYCVAPNTRGISPRACPKGKRHYSLDLLAKDVLDIAKQLQAPSFHLVGHDWGAAIGWKVVHDHPKSIASWAGISVPHLQAFGQAIVHDKEQQRMSHYIKAFQWPYLPELKIQKNDLALFRKLWKYSSEEEIEDYLSVFRNRKQLTAALNYYRSNYGLLKKAGHQEIFSDIEVPTLFIWGNKDVAIGSYAVEQSHPYMKNTYEFLELDAGHWLIQTNYRELESAIGQHIERNKIKKI